LAPTLRDRIDATRRHGVREVSRDDREVIDAEAVPLRNHGGCPTREISPRTAFHAVPAPYSGAVELVLPARADLAFRIPPELCDPPICTLRVLSAQNNALEAGFARADYVATAELAERYLRGRTDGLRAAGGEGILVART